jgi:hypothetical protein
MSLGTDSRLPSPSSVGALVSALPVWGLFGRFLLMLIGQILVVPSPWTSTAYYKFLCEHIALPDGKRLKFAGQAGDIWYVFIALALMIWFDQVIHYAGLPRYVGYLVGPAIWVLPVLLLKWFCANLRSEDDRLALRFGGGYWAYIGWNILHRVRPDDRGLGLGPQVHDAMDVPKRARDRELRLQRDRIRHPVENIRVRTAVHPGNPDSLADAVLRELAHFPDIGGPTRRESLSHLSQRFRDGAAVTTLPPSNRAVHTPPLHQPFRSRSCV